MSNILKHLGAVTALILGICSQSMAETASISVFEDHERYVIASDSYGLSWRLLEMAASEAGVVLAPEESSWKASMNRVKGHKVDFVFAAFKTYERSKWAAFTHPLMSDGSGIFTRVNNPVTSLADVDFENSIVGVSANSLQEQMALEMGFENIYSTVKRQHLYQMLQQQRIDYLFFGESIINYYCLYFDESRSRGCMKRVGGLHQSNTIHALTDSSNSSAVVLLTRINQSLLQVAKSENAKQLFADYGLDQNQYKQWLAGLTLK